jgi:hypothetical protein
VSHFEITLWLLVFTNSLWMLEAPTASNRVSAIYQPLNLALFACCEQKNIDSQPLRSSILSANRTTMHVDYSIYYCQPQPSSNLTGGRDHFLHDKTV